MQLGFLNFRKHFFREFKFGQCRGSDEAVLTSVVRKNTSMLLVSVFKEQRWISVCLFCFVFLLWSNFLTFKQALKWPSTLEDCVGGALPNIWRSFLKIKTVIFSVSLLKPVSFSFFPSTLIFFYFFFFFLFHSYHRINIYRQTSK